MDGNESGEFNFPEREFWHTLQSFPEIYSTLTIKVENFSTSDCSKFSVCCVISPPSLHVWLRVRNLKEL